MIRAKMNLHAIIPNGWGGMKAVFMCQYDGTLLEDQKFQKATPSGNAEFHIDNPHAFNQLVQGGNYYFDITPCDARSDGMNEKEQLLRKLRAHIDAGGSVSIDDRTYTKKGDDIVVTNTPHFKVLPAECTEGSHSTEYPTLEERSKPGNDGLPLERRLGGNHVPVGGIDNDGIVKE